MCVSTDLFCIFSDLDKRIACVFDVIRWSEEKLTIINQAIIIFQLVTNS